MQLQELFEEAEVKLSVRMVRIKNCSILFMKMLTMTNKQKKY